MKIVVIDTGIETNHKALHGCQLIGGITIYEKYDSTFQIIDNSFEDEYEPGHGTGILAIIYEHNAGINPYVIKLKSHRESFSENLLCEGIAHALLIEDIKIINISMGVATEAPSDRLRQLCAEAYKRGIFIVSSAYSNSNKPCYPAYFDNVFGVGKGYFMSNKLYQYIPENKINILAKGTNQKVATIGSNFSYTNGTSYATAHFTGILSLLLQKNELRNKEEILKTIKQNSSNPIIEVPLNYTKTEELLSYKVIENNDFTFYSTLDNSVKRVALFPINSQDLRSVVHNMSLFSKEIVIGIDFPECFDSIENVNIPIIKRIPTKDDLALFDSIVISNITDGFGMDDFKLSMLRQFIIYNKNIITWDLPIYSIVKQIITKENHKYTGKIYFPYYSESFMRESYLNLSLPPSESIPSLSVIKMEENNESFVYQYVLSNILENRGYDVSNIVVDPHGILFGNTDIVFPFITKRMVDLEWEKWGVFLRLAKRLVAFRRHPDIFISEISNLLHNYYNEDEINENDELLKKTIFLKGIKPDTYIGVISLQENIRHIEKTYTYLNNVLGIEPLFFLTDKMIDSTNGFMKFSNKKKYIVLNINDSKKIIKMIEKRFSN
jgi:Subtilase family